MEKQKQSGQVKKISANGTKDVELGVAGIPLAAKDGIDSQLSIQEQAQLSTQVVNKLGEAWTTDS